MLYFSSIISGIILRFFWVTLKSIILEFSSIMYLILHEDQESDVEFQESSNPSPSVVRVRRSTAFFAPDLADVTDPEPLDISLDACQDSCEEASVPEEELLEARTPPCSPDFGSQDCLSNPAVRSYQFSPDYISSTRRKDGDINYEEETAQFPDREESAVPLPPLVINSPADLIKLCPRTTFSDENHFDNPHFKRSTSEDASSSSSKSTEETEDDNSSIEGSRDDARNASRVATTNGRNTGSAYAAAGPTKENNYCPAKCANSRVRKYAPTCYLPWLRFGRYIPLVKQIRKLP